MANLKPIESTPLIHPFVEMMKRKREDMGISGREMIRRIGACSKGHISAIEQGKGVPSVEFGLAICQILDIPMHLCLDYIAEYNIKRARERMQNEYIEWLSYVPPNVLDDVLQDEASLEAHHILSTAPIQLKEDTRNEKLPPMWAIY